MKGLQTENKRLQGELAARTATVAQLTEKHSSSGLTPCRIKTYEVKLKELEVSIDRNARR